MKKILGIFLLSLFTVSCGDFTEINTNPDASTQVPPEFLATQIIYDLTYCNGGGEYFDDSWLMKTTSFMERNQGYLYNKFYRATFSGYTQMIEGVKMENTANDDPSLSQGVKDAYRALNLFAQAMLYYNMTMSFGDIPCSDALSGEKGNFAPKYDPQEQVFAAIIGMLDEASGLFAGGGNIKGDFVYGGDVSRWEKANNSFMLRVLNMLSNKTTVGSHDIRSLFETYAAKSLIDSNENAFMRTFSTKSTEYHPFYEVKNSFWNYPILTNFLIKKLKDNQDPRLFYYGEPSVEATAAGLAPNDPNAYAGPNPTMAYASIQAQVGKYSAENKRYYKVPQGEPYQILSYSDTEFILAEAAVRGWATPASAKTHYDNAVTAAMQFTAAHTPAEYNHGVVINNAAIAAYLSGPAAFNSTGTAAQKTAQIMDQKLIGSFLQMRWNSFFDYRRTGYPVIPIDPATNQNEISDKIPTRWMYPENEYSQNRVNIEEALTRQFNGSDNPNNVMWLLKP